jgi:hypothetical protein
LVGGVFSFVLLVWCGLGGAVVGDRPGGGGGAGGGGGGAESLGSLNIKSVMRFSCL